MADIRITGLGKRFGATEVLRGIDLEIRSGEFVVFVGPSGCGKSTLLRCISGLESISEGVLEIGGVVMNDVQPSKRSIAMVFQSYALYPHMSVYDNMAYALKLRHESRAEIDRKVREAARLLQLTDYLQRRPRALSGGQRQRVAIGRAIVRDPKVFLFDEPLSNLDAALRVATRIEIARLKASMPQTTMIYVTHDQVEAMTLADRIVVLNEGRIEQVGTPLELYATPRSLFVAGFIGSPKMNFLTGARAEPYGAYTLGLRPEHLTLHPGGSADAGALSGKVIFSENLGADNYAYVEIGTEHPLVVRGQGNAMHSPGEEVHVLPDPATLYRFDAEGSLLQG